MIVRSSNPGTLVAVHSPLQGMLDWAEAGPRREEHAVAGGLDEVAQGTWALIVEILDGYLIPSRDVQQLLDDAFRLLECRWGRLARPDIWLVMRINHGCVDWWRRRSREQFRQQGRAETVDAVQWMKMCDRVEAVIAWRLSRRLRRTPDVSRDHPGEPGVADLGVTRWSDGT